MKLLVGFVIGVLSVLGIFNAATIYVDYKVPTCWNQKVIVKLAEATKIHDNYATFNKIAQSVVDCRNNAFRVQRITASIILCPAFLYEDYQEYERSLEEDKK